MLHNNPAEMDGEYDSDSEHANTSSRRAHPNDIRRRPTKKWWQQSPQQPVLSDVEMKKFGSSSKSSHREPQSEGESSSRKQPKPKFRCRRASTPGMVIPLTDEDKKAMKDAELLAKLPSAIDYAMLTAITCPWQPFPVLRTNSIREFPGSLDTEPLLLSLPKVDPPQRKPHRKKDINSNLKKTSSNALNGGQNHDRFNN
ncbi:hypothetical protein FRC17_008998 [Serendipita sp. 399]|nr:hypothetical protein FRC17_008998 [Serendipita sp. 399]